MDDLHDPHYFTFPDPAIDSEIGPTDGLFDGPSLAIVLISAVVGMGSGVIVLYVTYQLLYLIAPLSAGLATLALLGGIGVSAGLLSRLTHSRSALLNAGLSCGLVFFTALFFGFCLLIGAVSATFLLG